MPFWCQGSGWEPESQWGSGVGWRQGPRDAVRGRAWKAGAGGDWPLLGPGWVSLDRRLFCWLSLSCFSFTPVGLNLHLRHRFLFKTPTFCPLCVLRSLFWCRLGEPSYPSVPTGKGFPPRLLRKAVSVVPCYETPPGLQPLDCSHRKDPAGLTAFRVLLPWARRGPPQSSWAPILQMSSMLRPVSSDQYLSPGYQAFSWA